MPPPTLGAVPDPEVPRRPALSPSRAADFARCPLLYRFRAVDRIPEPSTPAQARGVLVHAVLERVFDLPAAGRTSAAAAALVAPAWAALVADEPALADAAPDEPAWLEDARAVVDAWFAVEDPRRLEPAGREMRVEVDLFPGVPLKGFVDRLDVAPGGRMRVVDYKTGAPPPPDREWAALFGVRCYALALLRLRGRAPEEVRLVYLPSGTVLTHRPDAAGLGRLARTLEALWAAVLAAAATGEFAPRRSAACGWCPHQVRCPAWGGTPPPWPGWPGRAG